MGDANPISEPETLRIEAVHADELDFWDGNLRHVLDQSSRAVAAWVEGDVIAGVPPQLQVWGPQAPLLVDLTTRTTAAASGGPVLLRFPDPQALAQTLLPALRRAVPSRIFVVQRAMTALDRVAVPTRDPVACDPNIVLRLVHLHLDYTLKRHANFVRRGAKLHLAEFVPAADNRSR